MNARQQTNDLPIATAGSARFMFNIRKKHFKQKENLTPQVAGASDTGSPPQEACNGILGSARNDKGSSGLEQRDELQSCTLPL